ncbi:MAG: hypothetical protein V1914_02705 [archaeon]
MNRKERIDSKIKELDKSYGPNEEFKTGLNPIIEKLYDPSFPEDQIDGILEQVKDAYRRQHKTKEYLDSARTDLEATVENIKKIGENYKKFGQSYAEIKSQLTEIAKSAPEILKTLQDSYVQLTCAKQTAEETTREIEQVKSELSDYLKNQGYKPVIAPIGPKDIN